MDFGLTQEQQDLKSLIEKMFGDLVTPERLPSFEEPQDWFDEALWKELARAGLLGLALPADVGGSGLGLIELGILLEQSGRFLAPVPLHPTLVLGALAIDAFGSPSLREQVLPRVVSGDAVLTAALVGEAAPDPLVPTVRATRDGGAWKLEGTRAFVPAASRAEYVLVPAQTGDGELGVFAVRGDAAGLSLEAQATTTGELEYRITLDGVAVPEEHVLGDCNQGRAIVAWIVERATAGLCAIELGVAEEALKRTAAYVSERKQFGKVLATFQAVAQRAADAFIDVEAVRLATWQAIWRLASGLPAAREVAIAKFWAAEGGHRACYAAQHLHGGIGVDTDYPLHRYYLQSRRIELTLGSAREQLAALGAALAGTAAERA
ncbi:MAG: acyl-CoA dehydrogenase [Deltaproteobacteria bacterium]|nr:MAG: acyl-CoA dehydrogenase [Deltaproteobacteria bacterium]